MKYIIKSIHETAALINQNGASLARFGDGELDIMRKKDIPYQKYDPELSKTLSEILHVQSSPKFLVGIPDVFQGLERYNRQSQDFWRGHRQIFHEYLSSSWYVTAFLSRPYMDLENKNEAAENFKAIKSLWEKKNILIVEGSTSRSGVGNDLFENAESVTRIICPSHNAYDKIDQIYDSIKKHGKDRLIFLMLGPTAKVLVYRLFLENIQAIDIGHIDSEYEWYQMNAKVKTKLSHKHTAEYNYDDNIILTEDTSYEESIVDRI